MSITIDALARGELQRGLSAATREANRITAELSGAHSEPVKQSATVLMREMKRLVGTRGTGTGRARTSAPGQPPRARTRRLFRSIGTAVVDGIRRVGSGLFTARLLEFGFTSRGDRPTIIAPRPFARPALENVAAQMVDTMVSEAQKRVAKV